MNQLIGCCGLDCEICDARIATFANDEALREKTAALWTKLNGVTITPDMINCAGCRIEGAKTPFCDKLCPVHNCVREKGLDTCADCRQMEGCPTLGRIAANSPCVLENLNRIRAAKSMKRYVALLRGVNISGKNKVMITQLTQGLSSSRANKSSREQNKKGRSQQIIINISPTRLIPAQPTGLRLP